MKRNASIDRLPFTHMSLKLATLLTLTLLPSSRAQAAQFFRIVGPGATTITSADRDGYLTWMNASFPATITIQTSSSLLSPTVWVDYVQVPVTGSSTTHRVYHPNTPADMAFIPPGLFTMGDTFGEGGNYELPLHDVNVSAFHMDKYEVTKELWDGVYGWATNHGYIFQYGARGKANNHPAHSVTWHDAVKWCNARSEKELRTPAYYTDAKQTNVYRGFLGIMDNSWVKWDAGYRLPTEAEWEKAARGGASGRRFPWSATDNISHSRVNYEARP
ncbi:MAG: SUMF1/EgtB/PvdO family nonheme iron enzyme, partial [Verrucomicrobiota bacterium]